MKNTKRKGFTIVELVIVIAVIAILAAVLIPTFASLVKKANVSADEQAVKQMNTALAIYTAENGAPTTAAQVKKALDENLINAESMIPVSQGYAFYWHKEDNEIVLISNENKSRLENGTWSLLSTTGYGTKTEADTLQKIKDAIGDDKATQKDPALITLTADITGVSEVISVNAGKCVVIDLDGHTLTASIGSAPSNKSDGVFSVSNGGSLTIKNGTISSNMTAFSNVGGNLSLNGVKISVCPQGTEKLSDARWRGVYIAGISDTSIVSCSITTTADHGVGTNSEKNENDGARIIISNSDITTTANDERNGNGYAGVLVTISADVTIEDNCTITGVGHGAFFRGCSAKISDSTFTHTQNDHTDAWASGNSGPVADITFACGGSISQFTGYITTGSYSCENVTANKIIVHQPTGGTVNVSGIENYHKCTDAGGTTCTGDDATCGKNN